MWQRFSMILLLAAALLALPGALGQQQQKTNRPTSAPTAMPSDSPSSIPTQSPTQSQAPSTSHAPTATNQPTHTPPTGAPSQSPSINPTTAPTPDCHDVASYQSPLNELRCEDHAGTDCFRWRLLGLNPDEVEELINSCPISCDIPCDSFLNFDVELYFVLRNADNFLAPESTDIIEETTMDYLTRYARPLSPESRFTLHGVELISQTIADGGESNNAAAADADTTTRRWIRRRDQEESQVDLMVSFAYRGFALHLNETSVEDILLEAIFSPGYARMLRFTDDWALRNVEIAELTAPIKDNLPDAKPDPNTIVMKNDGSLSAGAIVACIFSALVILSVSGAFFFLQRRKHRTMNPDLSFSFDKNDDELNSELNSPGGSARSPLRDVISFDSVVRLMTSFSGGGGAESRSASPTDLEGDSIDQKSRQSKDVQNKESDDDDEDDGFFEEEHPYTNLIPPMIVYDHIDLDEEQDDTTTRSKLFKNVVPSKKVAATKVFAESLHRENGNTLDESTYENVLRNIGIDQRNVPAHQEVLKPIVSDEENRESPPLDADASFGSHREFRKTLSDSCLDVPSQNSPSMVVLDAREDRKQPYDHLANVSSIHSSPLPPSKFNSSASVDGLETIGADPDTTKVKNADPIGKVGKSIWGFSPAAWKTSVPTSRSHSPSLSPEKLSQLARRSNRSSDPDLSDLFDHDAVDGVQLVFQASRKGKLGLVIQCLDDLGPVVTQVKDYSPLLGQVLPGDRIVDIDGMSTSGMSLRDVTGLMGGKVAQSRWAASVFRIVVWRQNNDLLKHLDANPSSSALLLSDSPVTSERRTSVPRSMATPPRNRGVTPPPPPSIPTLANKTPPRSRSTSLTRNEGRLRSSSLTRSERRGPSPSSRKRSSSLTRSERSDDSGTRKFLQLD